ncbi:MAG: glycosyltransferase family A protein [Candidatus Wallbacteria bacterium]|nr:glycosyltransferase family A protein [Candidatus Wallbacteria bacterium]
MSEIKGLVSVIVPTYNRPDLLPRAVLSVIKQTYRNLEVIIVADQCLEATGMVIEGLLRTDSRISALKLAENVGGAEARNIGIGKVRGEFIAFLDDDDEWLPEKLDRQIAVISSDQGLAIVSCNHYLINRGRKVEVKIKPDITLKDMLYRNFLGSFSFCVTRKSLLADVRINRDLKAFQDQELWLKILSGSGGCAFVVQEPLVNYFQSHGYQRLTQQHENTLASLKLLFCEFGHLMNHSQKHYNAAAVGRLSIAAGGSFSPGRYLKMLMHLCLAKRPVSLQEIYAFAIQPLFGMGRDNIVKRAYYRMFGT